MDIAGPVDSLAVPRFAGIATFLRLPWITDLSQLDVALVGVPFDGGQGYRSGARFAPRAVREASAAIKRYNVATKTNPYARFRVGDYGDLVTNPLSLDDSHRRITEQMDPIVAAGVIPISVGGDHSISLPILRAIAKRHGRVGLIQFDAHHDCWDQYFGNKYGNGSPFRRAVEEDLVDPRKMVQIGLRGPGYSEDDYAFGAAHGIRSIMIEEMYDAGIAVVLAELERLRGEKCYVTFDIDSVDPAFAPATSSPTPGGFTSADAIRMIRNLKGFTTVGFDVVEVSPMYDDASRTTCILAATLAFEYLCTL
jgi:guanidinopropionase